MSFEADNLMYDDDGNPLGYLDEADDGNLVLHDGQGGVIAAAMPDGTPLDVADYEMHDVGQLEQAPPVEQQSEQPYVPGPDVNWVEVEHQLADVQRMLGRRMTTAEQQALAENLDRQASNGERPDAMSALGQAFATGAVEPIDLSTRQGKVDYVMDRIEQETPQPEPQDTEHDMSTRDGKASYVMARLAGGEVAEQADEAA